MVAAKDEARCIGLRKRMTMEVEEAKGKKRGGNEADMRQQRLEKQLLEAGDLGRWRGVKV